MTRNRDVVFRYLTHFLPCCSISLASLQQRTPEKIGDTVSKTAQRRHICRHCVVSIISLHDPLQPFAQLRDGLVSVAVQNLFNHLEFRLDAVFTGFPVNLEFPVTCFTAHKREPKESKGFRFSKTFPLASTDRMAAKLNQSSLIRMEG